MKHVLAIDAGQTGIKTSLFLDDISHSESNYAGLRTDSKTLPQLARVIDQEFERLDGQFSSVSLGVSGIEAVSGKAEQISEYLTCDWKGELRIAHDSVSSYLACLGTELGVSTAAGTGAVTLGVGDNSIARVDGWGNILGDDGSGFWLGRSALKAALRAHDGRGPMTSLVEFMADFPNPESIYLELQSDDNRVSRIAGYARRLFEHVSKDSIASQIALEAADELALSVASAAKRTGLLEKQAFKVSWSGAVLASNPIFQEMFTSSVSSLAPNALIVAPKDEPRVGAYRLSTLNLESPLGSLVSRAVT